MTSTPSDTPTSGHARTRTIALAAALALVVAGIVAGIVVGVVAGRLWGAASADPASPTVSALAGQARATDHDAADVRFAQEMTPHHTQATEMARLARTRAGSRQVVALAAGIAAAQGPEITTMRGWLRDWDAQASSGGGGMAGMMSADEMTSLAQLSGRAFDRAFLTMMTAHHTGALTMARTELADGRNAGALALAASVEVTQRAEIRAMKALLAR